MHSSSPALFLGVDGGATRSRARIRDGEGRLLGEAEAGPANTRLGLAQTLREVLSAARGAASAAGLGACGGKDGAILIVGTGSCGLAVVDGQRINVGGWGDVVSDDGSGNAIGRAALRRALWALEGLAPAGALAEAILAGFERDPEKMVAWAM